MKTNIKIFFAVGMAALFTGCTDLDVTPVAQFTEYPTSEAAVEAQMADVYFHLRGTLGRRYMEAQALSSDEWVGISFDGDYADGGIYAQCSLHNFNASNASTGWYEDVTAGITKANRVILNMGGIENKGTAQARFMRAFYTWIIMDSYGDAPILDHLLGDNEQIDRSPRADVARWIESELKAIIDLLPTNVDVSTYGKPTRYVAEALLAKLYINWPVYTASSVTAYDAANYQNEHINDVVALCDDIIASEKFSLSGGANGYRSKFWPNNGPQIKDFIYSMPFDAITAQGFQYCRPRIWRQGRNDGNGGPGYFGSDIHMMSVQKLWELLPDGFLLIDSDILVKKNLDWMFQEDECAVGYVHTSRGMRAKPRLAPLLLWINVPMCVAGGAVFFDPNRAWALHKGSDKRNYWDTGAALLDDIKRLKPQCHGIAISRGMLTDYMVHLGNGSWAKNDTTIHQRWLEQWLKVCES